MEGESGNKQHRRNMIEGRGGRRGGGEVGGENRGEGGENRGEGGGKWEMHVIGRKGQRARLLHHVSRGCVVC